MKINKFLISTVLASAIWLTPMKLECALQTGGLATNQVSGGSATAQKVITQTAAWISLISNALACAVSFIPEIFPVELVYAYGFSATVVPSGGPVAHGINFDFMGAALDAMLVYDAYHKKSNFNDEIPELQAAVRQIAEMEDLEGECEGGGDCNELNAKQDKTEVHVATLKNVGLEALEDVAGKVLIEPEELIAAAPYIQTGFGTTSTEVSSGDAASATAAAAAAATAAGTGTGTQNNTQASGTGTQGSGQNQTRTLTDEERRKMDLRKQGHLQLTGTAGVARSDLGITVAIAEQKMFDKLKAYVGSGGGLTANVKVLCGLDLTLAQRLNLLNMFYGQQAANEAASALQLLEDK